MQAFRDNIARFEGLSAQVLGVSPDSLETHERFSRELGLAFPLVSDEEGEIAKLYPGRRATYIIDSDGIVRFFFEGFPDVDILLRIIREMAPKAA